MKDPDSEGPEDADWDDGRNVAWNEFDWERYLREQDETIHRYLGLYEALLDSPQRIDEVAELMGWEDKSRSEDASPAPEDRAREDEPEDFVPDDEVYTLHKNPVFIATKAIYLGLRRPWELAAARDDKVPRALSLAYLAALHRGEDNAVQAIHALDFGDFAMSISLFKRALSALNDALAVLNKEAAERHEALAAVRRDALPRLFDLREVWLRVINECRQELNRPIDEES
jgi:hypothetical protein